MTEATREIMKQVDEWKGGGALLWREDNVLRVILLQGRKNDF